MLPTPEIGNLNLDKVYEPAEDSYLLLDCFEQEQAFLKEKFTDKIAIVTEIGTGSGIVTSFIRQYILPTALFLATDLNPHACEAVISTVKENNKNDITLIDALQMDLATGIRNKQTDILIFNPPYVPADTVPQTPTSIEDPTWLDLALLGGDKGMEITWKVLHNLDIILSDQGAAYILFCARNFPDEVTSIMKERGWSVEVIIHRKAGWEVLSVLKFCREKLKGSELERV